MISWTIASACPNKGESKDRDIRDVDADNGAASAMTKKAAI